jgi:hypothetical protein
MRSRYSSGVRVRRPELRMRYELRLQRHSDFVSAIHSVENASVTITIADYQGESYYELLRARVRRSKKTWYGRAKRHNHMGL